ncbi:hypothetical protein NFI96_008785 [Prochilodus magdalenae]|nr:hypothetical protein NFI96_008785 [Prochilodus magdalenae]
MITALQNFTVNEVTELRFLLHGPVGAGKSSIINTIKTIFEGHQFINCLAASELTGHSFTKKHKKYPVGTLPFAFYDVMGLELDRGKLAGAHQDDIIKALKGHIPDDYEYASFNYISISVITTSFRPEASMSEDNKDYISNPTLNDQIHCLISVVAADKVTIMEAGIIQKMKTIRAEASKLRIPQLVFMTRVDQACKITHKDLTKIYRSKKIKKKMEECNVRLGIPMNCIFPVKNYHEETKANSNLNCLVLEALMQAVYSAHDYVKNRGV